MLSAAGGCKLSTTTRVKTAWKNFKELIPVLSSRHLSFKTCGSVYSSCVRNAKLNASETRPLTKPSLKRLQQNDKAMIGQICNVKPQYTANIRSTELLAWLGTEDLDLILKERVHVISPDFCRSSRFGAFSPCPPPWRQKLPTRVFSNVIFFGPISV